MAVETGKFTHTLEQIDDAVTEVTNAKGQSASLSDAMTAAAESVVSGLDYTEVGGSGKYISAIKEENGIIVPTPTNLASAPASGGTAAISSGAVYTALSGKIGISDVFGIGSNNLIPDGADLNASPYTTAGIYVRQFSTNMSTLSHIPMDNSTYDYAPFKLIVEYTNSANNIRQTLIPNYNGSGYFVRMRLTGASGTWQNWRYFSGTEVTPPASLNSINPAQLQSTPPDDDEMR